MAAFVACLVLLLAMVGHSAGIYCVCNSGVSDTVLQKNIDYACANGADCSAINQNGACYNPNTVKDHCNYAVNSYYQKKSNLQGSCDFQGTANLTANPPSTGSGCVYQSSPSGGGTTTPSTSPPTTTSPPGGTTTPGTMSPPSSTTNPGGTMAPPPPGGTTTGTMPGSTMSPGFGLGPTGSGFGTDSSSSVKVSTQSRKCVLLVVSFYLCLLISGRF